MANPALTTHQPLKPISTISGNQEEFPIAGTTGWLEAAGQTWQQGTPVQKATTGPSNGYFIASTPSNGSTQVIIAGVAYLNGQNLASNGAGAPPALFGSYGFPGGITTGSVLNQPSAVNIPHGAPFLTGIVTGGVANLDTIWEVQVDSSSGATFNATNTLINSTIALNIDSSGFWYADLKQINNTSYADVICVGLNPQDYVSGSLTTQVNNGRIYVTFNTAVLQPAI